MIDALLVLIDEVRFRCHDEIVAVQTANRVGPPADGDLAPFGKQRRVVILLLSNLTNLVGKCQRFNEVLEAVSALQAWNAILFHDLPARDLLD